MQVGEQTMRNRDENLLEVYRIGHELLSARECERYFGEPPNKTRS